MFNVFDSEIYAGGLGNPAYKFLVGDGYDPHNYISTAKLVAAPYTSLSLLEAEIGGVSRLVDACNDTGTAIANFNPNNPPNNPALAVLNSIIQNVTTEINGYLSSVYPIPLMQTGTVCVLQVTSLSSDGNNSVTGLDVVVPGNYLTAPTTSQAPAYMRYIDPLAEERLWANIYGYQNQMCFSGTGLELTVAYSQGDFADESGQPAQTFSVTATPAIVNGGQNYRLNDLLVLTGGSSVVPAKVREAALTLVCWRCYNRRLAPAEKNMFHSQMEKWRGTHDRAGLLTKIGEGEMQLDGTYKRFYSAAMSWNKESVLNGANSL